MCELVSFCFLPFVAFLLVIVGWVFVVKYFISSLRVSLPVRHCFSSSLPMLHHYLIFAVPCALLMFVCNVIWVYVFVCNSFFAPLTHIRIIEFLFRQLPVVVFATAMVVTFGLSTLRLTSTQQLSIHILNYTRYRSCTAVTIISHYHLNRHGVCLHVSR